MADRAGLRAWRMRTAVVLGLGGLLCPVAGGAQGIVADSPGASQQTTQQYWNAQRLKAAKPMELLAPVGVDGSPAASTQSAPSIGKPSSGSGAPPTVTGTENRLLFVPAPPKQAATSDVRPDSTSSYGARHTTARDPAPSYYPSSTVGQLFFHDPRTGGNFVCSASVLRPRIVVTAGHCVAHPSTDASQRYFYTGHYFVPALTSGSAPYGTWVATKLLTTAVWYNSDGSVPNAEDEGILVIADQMVGNAPVKIASRTGYLGWTTFSLSNNNVTMKGYPCNLDGCSRMESTNAQTFAFGGNNTYVYGSAMRGGASGGPWVQDFGVSPVSNPAVAALGGNHLVGVTSYGPVATEPAYLGASQLDATFINLLAAACGLAAGNC